jgi:hypothetical protein
VGNLLIYFLLRCRPREKFNTNDCINLYRQHRDEIRYYREESIIGDLTSIKYIDVIIEEIFPSLTSCRSLIGNLIPQVHSGENQIRVDNILKVSKNAGKKVKKGFCTHVHIDIIINSSFSQCFREHIIVVFKFFSFNGFINFTFR